MMRIRGALLGVVIALGTVFVPAQKSEAGLLDWMSCALNPFEWPCDSCGSRRSPACAAPCSTCQTPVVNEGAYCNPCATCNTTYVRRSYMEPRTRVTTQYALEPRPTFVRRLYWDPCSLGYKTHYECSTSFVQRKYCVPVTDFVERSYLEPVTSCVTPSCPTSACPIAIPPTVPEGNGLNSSASLKLRGTRLGTSQAGSILNSPSPTRAGAPTSTAPRRDPTRPSNGSASRPAPLAVSSEKMVY